MDLNTVLVAIAASSKNPFNEGTAEVQGSPELLAARALVDSLVPRCGPKEAPGSEDSELPILCLGSPLVTKCNLDDIGLPNMILRIFLIQGVLGSLEASQSQVNDEVDIGVSQRIFLRLILRRGHGSR